MAGFWDALFSPQKQGSLLGDSAPMPIATMGTGYKPMMMSGYRAAPQPQGGGWASGLSDWMSQNPNVLLAIAAGMGGAHSLGQGISDTAQMVAPARQTDMRNAAITKYIKANPKVDQQTIDLIRSDPAIGEAMISAQLTPHPFTPIVSPTGAIMGIEPYSGGTKTYYDPAAGAGLSGANASGMPAGFIFTTAKQYADPSTMESGLVDQNGKKWVLSHPKPTPDQAASAEAFAAATSANDVLTRTEAGETGTAQSIIRGMSDVPVLGPLTSLAKGDAQKENENARKQFLAAVRGLVIAKGLNPESAEYSSGALFADFHSPPAVLKQKAAYRQQILEGLGVRAGPFKLPGAPPAAPVVGDQNSAADATAGAPPATDGGVVDYRYYFGTQ